ncbi:hypothetical protein CU097_003451 [Rhizopus azygosporus]|uniref:Uncharacterized protein n=1 Tax=Rhizopus azygosporus TaxID=86630 RepID=A0A367J4F8_RHIAZ|nr:hypothetical protein CU097_003451 [Rhizopus azygosporus]
MFLNKWTLLALVTGYLLVSSQPPIIRGSLSDKPSDLYTPDFYPNGTYLTLPHGTMRYWMFGNEQGNPVILIHGITTGSSCYDKLARELANSGHHVVVYDLWGRGYSDAPHAYYDEALYTSQLALLMHKIGWTRADVIGVSLGGGIATSFTAFYPEMVRKLVLIAPTGLMQQNDLPLTSKVARLPILSQVLIGQPLVRPLVTMAIRHFAASARHTNANAEEGATELTDRISQIAYHQFVHHPGFFRAFLRTVIDFPFTGLKERYERVGQLKGVNSTLLIWGDQDKTVPFHNHVQVHSSLPHAQLVIFNNQGHDVLITSWKSVNAKVKDFLLL